MAKKNSNNNSSSTNTQTIVEELKKRIVALEDKNKTLENHVMKLEDKQATLSHVNSMLSEEVDRLNQYTRRSNIVIKNVFAPEKETVEQVEEQVKKIINKMGIPEVLPDFDKAHRLGKVKDFDGKKHQDVIVRFKSHSSRYKVFNKRKSLKNIRISPNLTQTRSKMLAEAVELIKEKIYRDDWGFVFANQHGDLLIRLQEKFNGKHYFPFNSLETLTLKLEEIGLLQH